MQRFLILASENTSLKTAGYLPAGLPLNALDISGISDIFQFCRRKGNTGIPMPMPIAPVIDPRSWSYFLFPVTPLKGPAHKQAERGSYSPLLLAMTSILTRRVLIGVQLCAAYIL
jgi:hypothetical protein